VLRLVPTATRLVVPVSSSLERVNALTLAFASKGMASAGAHASALATLDGIVNQQSAVLSFADTFWAVGALVLVCLRWCSYSASPHATRRSHCRTDGLSS